MTYYLLVWVIGEAVPFLLTGGNFSLHTITMVLLTTPGVFTAGFLGSSRPFIGAIYRMVVVIVGVVLPLIAFAVVFLELIGVGSHITVVAVAVSGGLFTGVGLFGGGVGGALGAMTKAQRTNQREEETLN